MNVEVTVNGETYERDVDPRRLLIHFIRDDLDLTGSHVGCDTGNCGACTLMFNGDALKSCMLLAVQANGATTETVESLSQNGELDGLQQAFSEHHALGPGGRIVPRPGAGRGLGNLARVGFPPPYRLESGRHRRTATDAPGDEKLCQRNRDS
jgi:hypothetical protein